MNLVLLFAILSLLNVIFSTIRSLVTIKGGKWMASLVSALYFSYYTIVLVYTMSDFDLWIKCAITFGANLLGVFIVKLVEEKMVKDKLWVFNATVKEDNKNIRQIVSLLNEMNIKCLYVEVTENLYTMQIFSYTQKESDMITKILENYDVKYYALETKGV